VIFAEVLKIPEEIYEIRRNLASKLGIKLSMAQLKKPGQPAEIKS
jgi:hypothetical protein